MLPERFWAGAFLCSERSKACNLQLKLISNKQGGTMKKLLSALFLGCLLLTGSAFAQQVDCKTITPCQTADFLFGYSPAVSFQVLEASGIVIGADFCDNGACSGAVVSTYSDIMDLDEGPNTLSWPSLIPPELGTVYGVRFRLGTCPETACLTYVIGTEPGLC